MEDILWHFLILTLLVAENDAMAMGAMKAIDEAGQSSKYHDCRIRRTERSL